MHSGTARELLDRPTSLTGAHLSGRRRIPQPAARRPRTEGRAITGVEEIDEVVQVDRSPIGRSPRSNPATYKGVFDRLRQLFAQTPEAKARGYRDELPP